MKYTYDLKFPKILIEQDKVFKYLPSTEVKKELYSDPKKNTSDTVYFFEKGVVADEKRTVSAEMSYKKAGKILIKRFFLLDGFDCYFQYNKDTGYFDKKPNAVSRSGNEYSFSDVKRKDFFIEFAEVLKSRFILGYITSDDKKQTVEYYLKNAHKYKLVDKYKIDLSECASFLNGIMEQSFVPEKFYDDFVKELRKGFYDTELSSGEKLKIETEATLSLMNEKKGKVAFDDINLCRKVLDKISSKRNFIQTSIVQLDEAMKKTDIR